SNGHTYLPEDKLKEYASRLLGVGIESLNDALVSLLFDNEVCMEKGDGVNNIYLSSLHLAENGVCKRLLELSSVVFRSDISDFDLKIERLQAEEGITLAEMQKIAIREALVNGLLVITGGPGTGKTTIIKSIIKLLDKEGYSIVLAAPTGRAAKRMSEATGFEAKTIHRLLEIGYIGTDNELVFQRNENNPLDADVIIIDEMSMVDILLMYHLLKAVPHGARLILVGDVNQLPSVGAGNVLKDIISSGVIQTVRLTEIYRQAEESMIIVNAHRINRGEPPLLNAGGKDFFFIQRNSLESIVKTVVELCSKRLPDTYGYDPMKHIQVLTPMRKGPAGVLNLNVELQKALNPAGKNKAEKSFRDFVMREGDRVMQIRNNYSLRWRKINSDIEEGMGVFNGDTGIIHEIDVDEHRLTVLFDDDKAVDYDLAALDEIEPAYAITIHKSQGSEFPVIVLPVFPGPQILLTRNLLYTAVTRAKDLVVIVGMEDILFYMVSNERETLRYSSLSSKLGSYFSKLEGLLCR
ncbi:MAG TPA: AAA family ATPase, partial [Clostridiaceae bacterium]|nr:AAA family ATPase [Clostridiaceae bacterium]